MLESKTQTHNVIYGPAGEPQFIAKGGEGFPTGIKGFVDIQVTDAVSYTHLDVYKRQVRPLLR